MKIVLRIKSCAPPSLTLTAIPTDNFVYERGTAHKAHLSKHLIAGLLHVTYDQGFFMSIDLNCLVTADLGYETARLVND
jgi:hypothetical protein